MDILSKIPLVQVTEHHQLHEMIVDDFKHMQSAAQSAGVGMDIASSYRSVERQLLIWNNKWSGKRPLYDRNGELLVAEDLSDDDKLKAILIWSALPGASRHHWGTDLDVYDAKAVEATGKPLELIAAEYTHGGPCFALAQWIDKYLESFGFYRPYLTDTGGVAIEPWHISHQGQSKKVESELSITEFETLLQQIDIRGRDTILKHLDWIWHVYVLNKGL